MAVDFYAMGEIVPCTVRVRTGDATGENVQIIVVYVRDGKKQQKALTNISNLKVSGDEITFDWDTKGALLDRELFLEFAIEARGSELWGRKKVALYHPHLEAVAVFRDGTPADEAVCSVKINFDSGFLASGRNYDTEPEATDKDGASIWTLRTDREGKTVFKYMPVGEVTFHWKKPHVLTKSGWKEEGRFTKTGPWRKAEVKKTPLIHFVWWGESEPPIAVPNQVAGLKTTVRYWTPPAGIADQLDPEITWNPIANATTLFNDDLGVPVHLAVMGRGAQMDRMFAKMAEYGMHDSVRDFVALCVLCRDGGYCFDARCAVSSPGTIEELLRRANIQLVSAGGSPGRIASHDRSAEGTFNAIPPEKDAEGVYDFTPVATWAMYAPPGHPSIATMIAAFIARCERLGLDIEPADVNIPMLGCSVHELLSTQGPERRRLIENLTVCSIQEGLLATDAKNFATAAVQFGVMRG